MRTFTITMAVAVLLTLPSCRHRPNTVFYSAYGPRPHTVNSISLKDGSTNHLAEFYSHGLAYDSGKKRLLVGSNSVLPLSLNGEFGKPIVRTGQIKDVVIDQKRGTIYWSQFGKFGDPNTIERCDLADGGNREVVVTATVIGRIGLDSRRGKLYWGQGNSKPGDVRGIYRSNLDGSGKERIGTNFSNRVIAVDAVNRKLFWVNLVDRKESLIIANLDGSNPQVINNNLEYYVEDLAVDVARRKLYWAQRKSGAPNKQAQILRSNYDGSDIEVVAKGATGNAYFMHIELGRIPCGAPKSGTGAK